MQKKSFSLLGRRYVIFAVALSLFMLVGCQQLLLISVWLIKGPDQDPKYDVLKKGKKKVVIVCRSNAMNQFQAESVPRDISKSVALLLKKNVKNKKLEIVDYRKVEQWLDDSSMQFKEFDEVGVAFKADIVIGVELQSFQIQNSTTTMQAHATWTVKTYDMEKDELIGEDTMTLTHPTNLSLPIRNGASIPQFQRTIVGYVSSQIAALYHPHDPRKVYELMDAHSLEYH